MPAWKGVRVPRKSPENKRFFECVTTGATTLHARSVISNCGRGFQRQSRQALLQSCARQCELITSDARRLSFEYRSRCVGIVVRYHHRLQRDPFVSPFTFPGTPTVRASCSLTSSAAKRILMTSVLPATYPKTLCWRHAVARHERL